MRYLVRNYDCLPCRSCGNGIHEFYTRGCIPMAFDDIEAASLCVRGNLGDPTSFLVAIPEDATGVVPGIQRVHDAH